MDDVFKLAAERLGRTGDRRPADYADYYNAARLRAKHGLPEAQTDEEVWQALEREHELPELAAKQAPTTRATRKPRSQPLAKPADPATAPTGGDATGTADDETADSDVRISMMLADRMSGAFLFEHGGKG